MLYRRLLLLVHEVGIDARNIKDFDVCMFNTASN
jgi:hypothetical protein